MGRTAPRFTKLLPGGGNVHTGTVMSADMHERRVERNKRDNRRAAGLALHVPHAHLPTQRS